MTTRNMRLKTILTIFDSGLAWDFDLRVMNATSSFPTEWIGAAKDISLDLPKALDADHTGVWVDLPKYTRLPVQSFELARTWSFNIKGSDYPVNVSQTQKFL